MDQHLQVWNKEVLFWLYCGTTGRKAHDRLPYTVVLALNITVYTIFNIWNMNVYASKKPDTKRETEPVPRSPYS